MQLDTSIRQEPIEIELPAPTAWPLALRAGVEAPGIVPPRGDEGGRP